MKVIFQTILVIISAYFGSVLSLILSNSEYSNPLFWHLIISAIIILFLMIVWDNYDKPERKNQIFDKGNIENNIEEIKRIVQEIDKKLNRR